MIDGLLGIQFNIEKAKLDGKVQNLASYINRNTLTASHKEMDGKKAKGIVTSIERFAEITTGKSYFQMGW